MQTTLQITQWLFNAPTKLVPVDPQPSKHHPDNGPKGRRDSKPRACQVDGIRFDSITSAAIHFGVCQKTVARVLSGNMRNTRKKPPYQGHFLDDEEPRKAVSKKAVPVKVNDVVYPSILSAADSLGIAPATIWRRLHGEVKQGALNLEVSFA